MYETWDKRLLYQKCQCGKIHVQKRYLLCPLREVLDMLNGSVICAGNSFKDMFEREL